MPSVFSGAPDGLVYCGMGVLEIAGIGVDLYKDEQDAFEQVHKPGRTFEPNADLTARYAEWFDTFERIYPALKPVNQALRKM